MKQHLPKALAALIALILIAAVAYALLGSGRGKDEQKPAPRSELKSTPVMEELDVCEAMDATWLSEQLRKSDLLMGAGHELPVQESKTTIISSCAFPLGTMGSGDELLVQVASLSDHEEAGRYWLAMSQGAADKEGKLRAPIARGQRAAWIASRDTAIIQEGTRIVIAGGPGLTKAAGVAVFDSFAPPASNDEPIKQIRGNANPDASDAYSEDELGYGTEPGEAPEPDDIDESEAR